MSAERTVVVPPGDGTKAGFLRAFAVASARAGLGRFPMHAVNWDAFEDALLSLLCETSITLRHEESPRLPAEDLKTYRAVLSHVSSKSAGRLSVSLPVDVPTVDEPRSGPPAVAVAHYHLNRGGVTRVVANHLLALRSGQIAPPSAVLLTGGRAEAWGDAERTLQEEGVSAPRPTVAGLDYDELNPAGSDDPHGLADRFETALADHRADRDATVLHIHNHALGKNVALPGAVALLAERGWTLLLQLHDFAEEFRPANYLRLTKALGERANLYPQAPQIHYAVLNGRDRRVLRGLGVPEERLHVLPNPVACFKAARALLRSGSGGKSATGL
ncbi:MAG: hypothetical protein AAF907_09255, partial [Planctomycetota bacterium]